MTAIEHGDAGQAGRGGAGGRRRAADAGLRGCLRRLRSPHGARRRPGVRSSVTHAALAELVAMVDESPRTRPPLAVTFGYHRARALLGAQTGADPDAGRRRLPRGRRRCPGLAVGALARARQRRPRRLADAATAARTRRPSRCAPPARATPGSGRPAGRSSSRRRWPGSARDAGAGISRRGRRARPRSVTVTRPRPSSTTPRGHQPLEDLVDARPGAADQLGQRAPGSAAR